MLPVNLVEAVHVVVRDLVNNDGNEERTYVEKII